MCLTCHIAFGVDSVSCVEVWRDITTQSGDRDDDRPRVFAHYGYHSTTLSVAKDRPTGMTFAAAVSMKGGGDPHAARLLAKWNGSMGWGVKKSL